MRLIDADELIKGFDLCIDTADNTVSVLIAHTFREIINKQPTIEERKTGRWIDGSIPTYAACSECGYQERYADENNFCPNCGASMGDTNYELY